MFNGNNLTCFKRFATSEFVNEIVAITQRTFTLTFKTPRNVSDLKILHCKERSSGIPHHLLFI